MSRYVSHHPTNYWGYKSSPTDLAGFVVMWNNNSPKVGTSIPSPDITSGGIGDLFGDVWGFPHHPWYVSNYSNSSLLFRKNLCALIWDALVHDLRRGTECVKWPPFCGSDMAWKPLNIREFMSIFPKKKLPWLRATIFQTRPYLSDFN